MKSATGSLNLVQDSGRPLIAESRFSQTSFASVRDLLYFFSLDLLEQRIASQVALRDSIRSAVTTEEAIARLGGLSKDLEAWMPYVWSEGRAKA